MPNISQVLKTEISRISRKEVKAAFKPLHSSTITLKKTIADLKKRLAQLESENKSLKSLQNKHQDNLPKLSEDLQKEVRFTSKGVKKLRERFGLSQEEFAKVLGISSQNVFIMEHKEGRLKFRGNTLAKLLEVRGLGKREVRKRIQGF